MSVVRTNWPWMRCSKWLCKVVRCCRFEHCSAALVDTAAQEQDRASGKDRNHETSRPQPSFAEALERDRSDDWGDERCRAERRAEHPDVAAAEMHGCQVGHE